MHLSQRRSSAVARSTPKRDVRVRPASAARKPGSTAPEISPEAADVAQGPDFKSPLHLARAAARVVVKTVRNSIYPPKENPFVDAPKDAAKPKNAGAKPAANRREGSGRKRAKDEKTGECFLKIVHVESTRLNAMVELVEKDLSQDQQDIPEEIQEKLRLASGQARLLVQKKMQQFEELCQKNINQKPGEKFPTTLEDLAGFWDMVKLQVDQVDRQFAEIDRLRKSGWVDTTESTDPTSTENEIPMLGTYRLQRHGSSERSKKDIMNTDSSDQRSASTKVPTPSTARSRPERLRSAARSRERSTSSTADTQRMSSGVRKKNRDKTPSRTVQFRRELTKCSKE